MSHPVRRSLLIAGLGSLVPRPGFGQADRMRVIGYITPAAQASLRDEVFRKGLRDLGYIEGQNATIDNRWPRLHHVGVKAVAAHFVWRVLCR